MKQALVPGQPASIFLLAVWSGWFFGFAEVIYLSLLKYLLDQAIFKSQHYVWTIPLMLSIQFFIIAVIIFIPALKWRSLANPGIVTAFFAFPGLMSLYFVKPRIHLAAGFLLALGISLQSGRMVAKRPQLFFKLVGVMLPVMAGVLFGIAIVMLVFFP